MTKPARKIRFSVYLTNVNLINFNSEAVTCLRPRWEMKVDKRFQGKAAGINLFFFFLIRKAEEMQMGLVMQTSVPICTILVEKT